MRDPYQILGVAKNASPDAIKSAYRKLAKKLHPDVNPGKPDIEQRFKEVSAAYDLLSDPAKKDRYDRGEIDAAGHERGFSSNPPGNSGGPRGRQAGPGSMFNFGNPEDLFAEFFSAMGGGPHMSPGRHPHPARGDDLTASVTVPFTEACLGGKHRISLPDGRAIDITIPPGTEDGHRLRLRGKGAPGPAGPGDLLLTVVVAPHPWFTRKGQALHLDAPISLHEAALGSAIRVPTLEGPVTVKVPKGTSSGAVLRLKSKGIPSPTPSGVRGDMFVTLKVVLPSESLPDDVLHALEHWAKKNPHDPRRDLGW